MEGEFSDAQIEAKIVHMKDTNAWTAAQLGQIKMAGNEAKVNEPGPHGADECVVRQAKSEAKKAAKKVCVESVPIFTIRQGNTCVKLNAACLYDAFQESALSETQCEKLGVFKHMCVSWPRFYIRVD